MGCFCLINSSLWKLFFCIFLHCFFSLECQAILDKYQVGKTCINKGFSGDAIKGCEAKFLSDLATVEYGKKLETKLKNDNSEMNSLINQVKNSKDPKQTADAMTRSTG